MILDEIVSIKKIGIKKTIDIEVDQDHLFYCNGILTHNSAAGDVADVTEESIQGGISKIQSADNVLAFIPNSGTREFGLMTAKWLKSRDSGAVGKVINFAVDWSTLTFSSRTKEEADALKQSGAHQKVVPQKNKAMEMTEKSKTTKASKHTPNLRNGRPKRFGTSNKKAQSESNKTTDAAESANTNAVENTVAAALLPRNNDKTDKIPPVNLNNKMCSSTKTL